MKKRIIAIFLSVLMIVGFMPTSQAVGFTYDNQVEVMYVGDIETGESYYKKQDTRVLPVASMSKLMTYLVAMDAVKAGKISLNDIVEINEEAASYNIPGYSRFDLVKGEKVSLENLLKGVLVVSGNDASTAVAIHVAGSVPEFVKLMNSKAKELGLSNSNFVNPTGLTITKGPKPQMNTMSAQDLFTLGRHIVKTYPEVEEYGKMDKLNIPERKFSKPSTLPLRNEMKGLMGLKTGYTEEAGYCFTGLFDLSKEENGFDVKIITVVMGADNEEMRAKTTQELVQYVTNNFVLSKQLNPDVPVVDITDESTEQVNIPLYPERSFEKILPLNTEIEMEYEVLEGKSAPYEDGEVMGKLVLKLDGKEIDNMNLISKGFIPKEGFFTNIFRSIQEFFDNILLLI